MMSSESGAPNCAPSSTAPSAPTTNAGATYSILRKKVELWRDRTTRVIMRNGTVDVLNANVTVELLTGETIFICSFEGKTTCATIWNRVEGELLSRGVVHPHIFGLAIKIGSDWIFVDPEAKVSKYFPKEWRCTSGSSNENKTLVLYCRIHFYLESIPPNFDVVSLQHYYIQLRQNLVTNPKLVSTNLTQAVAFAVQAELGDWKRNQTTTTNISSTCSSTAASNSSLSSNTTSASSSTNSTTHSVEFPRWIHSLNLDYSALSRTYAALAGLGQNAARIAFIKAITPQFNMHLYGMTMVRAKDGKDCPAWIGVTPKGIEIYQQSATNNNLYHQTHNHSHSHGGQNGQSQNEILEQPRVTFLWANITKLSFERKKFEIRGRNLKCACGGSTEKLTFIGTSELVPRHLLLLCRSTHQFSLSTAHSKLEQLQAHLLVTANNLKGLSNSTNAVNTSHQQQQQHHHHHPFSLNGGHLGTSNDSLLQHQHGHPHAHHTNSSSSSSKMNDEKMLDLSLWADGLLLGSSTGSESNDHQRVSVISNASSNTTSGIVSDRVYSLDGSEEELDLREADCCSEHAASSSSHHNTNNSTSLESLSQKPPPSTFPRLHNTHHLSTSHSIGNSNGSSTTTTTSNCTASSAKRTAAEGTTGKQQQQQQQCAGEEAKYWYCGSDCEDCCEEAAAAAAAAAASSSSVTGSCRSLLVRTIGGDKGSHSCVSGLNGQCECISCAFEEDDLDGLDLSENSPSSILPVHHHHHHHNSTPSMASEATLKAIDILSDSCSVNTITTENSNHQNSEVRLLTDNRGSVSEKGHTGEKIATSHGAQEQSQEKDVYGEISETQPKTTQKMPVPKPRLTKAQQDVVSEDTPSQNVTSNVKLMNGNDIKCRHKNQSANNSGAPSKTLAPKETECLTTKIASRKCLRTQRDTPITTNWLVKSSSENQINNSGNGISGDKFLGIKSKKMAPATKSGLTGGNVSRQKQLDETDSSPVIVHNSSISALCSTNGSFNYSDLDMQERLLRQGRYPCTRTVSDNFDTDSDYVQLPPLQRRPILHPPIHRNGRGLNKKQNANSPSAKLWKFVTGNKPSALNKSCGNLNLMSQSGEPVSHRKAPPPVPMADNMGTMPRRFSQHLPMEQNEMHNIVKSNKLTSRSTTALNHTGIDEDVRPEPPPRPKKLTPGVELLASMAASNNSTQKADGKAVDARIISSKPQILIQTAYATPATIAKPSQAQVLFRESQVPVNGVPSTTPGVAATILTASARSKSQIVSPTSETGLYHSQSMDNIYDTVANEDPVTPRKPRSPPPPPLYPKSEKTKMASAAAKNKTKGAPMIIRSNNYIDVHASAAVRQKRAVPPPNTLNNSSSIVGAGLKRPVSDPVPNSRCGSVPANLDRGQQGQQNTFYNGLQNMKPLSRAPIVAPSTQQQGAGAGAPNATHTSTPVPAPSKNQMTPTTSSTPKQTIYTSQINRSQIQHFKAQLYSDTDYVTFPSKDPRVSQQEYFDSKNLNYTPSSTSSGINGTPLINCMSAYTPYSLSDYPPPYLPPPPPYPSTPTSSMHNSSAICASTNSPNNRMSTSSGGPVSQLPSYQDSLYNAAMSSNTSQCSSSQYGYYAIRPQTSHLPHLQVLNGYGVGTSVNGLQASHLGLNAENLQRFLSTQSLMGGSGAGSNNSNNNITSTTLAPNPIYYPASTQSAPPLPQYKDSDHLIIENGMRKAVHKLLASSHLKPSDILDHHERIRLKLCRSDDSLYAQPTDETEQTLQKIYNLPPPPPYKRNSLMSPSDVDLIKLRARCSAMDLPFLKALCSETDLLTQQKQQALQSRLGNARGVRPTAHAHPTPNTTPRSSLTPMPVPSQQQAQQLPKPPLENVPLQVPPARPPKPAKLRQPTN